MRRVLLMVAVLLLPACASRTHIRSAIGTVSPASVNLSEWSYFRSFRTISLQWARIGPPVWVRSEPDGGYDMIGVSYEQGGQNFDGDFGYRLATPGRTNLIAVSFGPDGRLRRPTEQVRRDMGAMIPVLRRRAW